MIKEQPYILVHLTWFYLVEDEHIRHFRQQWETKTFLNAWFRASGDKKFDLWDLGYEPSEDRQDCRSGFLVNAFVQSINDDHGRDVGVLERLGDEFIHLAVQGSMSDPWIRPDPGHEARSEIRVRAGELDGESGEDEVDVSPVLIVP
jgi:hypothetical protein